MCYGIELYGDVSLVEYEGEFYNGMRYGNGKLCNKKNELIYEGEWYMNNPLELYSLRIERELKECAETSACLDEKMQKIKNKIES